MLYLPISNELICQNCGQVVSGKELQTSPEWTVDTDERERNRIRADNWTDRATKISAICIELIDKKTTTLKVGEKSENKNLPHSEHPK